MSMEPESDNVADEQKTARDWSMWALCGDSTWRSYPFSFRTLGERVEQAIRQAIEEDRRFRSNP